MPEIIWFSFSPLKSAQLILAKEAVLTPFGFKHDRTLAVFDAHGNVITQRVKPQMCLIRQYLDHDILTLVAPKLPPLSINLADPSIHDDRPNISIFKREGGAFDLGDAAAFWISKAVGKDGCRLVQNDPLHPRVRFSDTLKKDLPLHFQDADQLSFLDIATLDQLKRNLVMRGARPINANHYRMNFFVKGLGPGGEGEAKKLIAGDIPLNNARLCERCTVPQIDPETGVMDRTEPTATLKKFPIMKPWPDDTRTGPFFGSQFSPAIDREVTISTSDPLRIG